MAAEHLVGRLVKGRGQESGRIVPAVVLTARDQADALIAAAQQRAAQIVATAEATAEHGRSELERQAFAIGHAAGADAAAAEALQVLVASRTDADRARLHTKDMAVTLARRIAEKIVGRAVELSPDVLADIVGQALSASRARSGAVRLRVHPEQLVALEAARPRWLARAEAPGIEVSLVADASVGRAGCVVETAAGRLDARLETQLGVLEKALGPR